MKNMIPRLPLRMLLIMVAWMVILGLRLDFSFREIIPAAALVTWLLLLVGPAPRAWGWIIREAFAPTLPTPEEMEALLSDLTLQSRRQGILSLERFRIDAPVLRHAVTLCVDGAAPEFLQQTLQREQRWLTQELRQAWLSVLLGAAIGLLLLGYGQARHGGDDPGLPGSMVFMAIVSLFLVALALEVQQRAERFLEALRDGIAAVQNGMQPWVLRQTLDPAMARRWFPWPAMDAEQEEAELRRLFAVRMEAALSARSLRETLDAVLPDGGMRFSEMVRCEDRDIQAMLLEANNGQLLTATRLAGDEPVRKIFSNLSARAGLMLLEDFDAMPPVNPQEAEQAQLELLALLARQQACSKSTSAYH